MLRELLHVRQIAGDRLRRWFYDDSLELIVWYEPQDTIYGFQLCYDPQGKPHALTWTRDDGFSHSLLDDGEEKPSSNRTPMLRPGGPYDGILLRSTFLASACDLPAPERTFVEGKLAESVGSK